MVQANTKNLYCAHLALPALVKRRGADMISRMNEGLHRLTEREKETLRLLLSGHDAKTIARSLEISIHTVNERLREARRKLGVTSSREAARQLSQIEQIGPNSHADKEFGSAKPKEGLDKDTPQSGIRQIAVHSLIWVLGGIVIMSLIYAAILLSQAVQPANQTQVKAASSTASAPTAAQVALAENARRWLAIMDSFRWDESWNQSSAYFRSQITASQWAAKADPVRRPLGAVVSRRLKKVQTEGLPKQPVGEYVIVQFQTNFAVRANTIETVVLVHEQSGWSVAGYWILPDLGQ